VGGRLLDLVVGALSQLSPRQYGHQLIRALGHTSAPNMCTTWPRHCSIGSSAHTLTAVQRAAVAAIAHCDAFWQIDTNLLACYELPADRVALQAWRRQVFRH
jgi:hypothetical protein